jgi:hypothetical protein
MRALPPRQGRDTGMLFHSRRRENLRPVDREVFGEPKDTLVYRLQCTVYGTVKVFGYIRRSAMKTLIRVIVTLIVLVALAYIGQAQKAVKVQQTRLKWALKDGKITEEQYKKEVQDISFGKMLLNPRYVFATD